MIAPLAKLIDWAALQVLTRKIAPPDWNNTRLEEAVRFLRGEDFIPVQSQPAQVEFTDRLHFRFPSPRPCEFKENNVAYGRLYRCTADWQKRPVILLLHGWNSTPSHRFRFPLIARRCNRAGYNVATLEAPYHFQRRPAQSGALTSFNYLRLAERTAQAIAEIRAFIGWCLQQGCSTIALWGSSYGGWLAGLVACYDARLTAVVMAVPSVRANRSHARRVLWRRSREVLRRQLEVFDVLDTTSLNLVTCRPRIPKENILLIEAAYDLFAAKEPLEELWQLWGRPEIWRLRHGHFSFGLIGAPCLMANRVLRWLSPRLEKNERQPHPLFQP